MPRVPVPGLHHVTAVAGDPQRSLDFYAGPMGLHLVKLTVNFDDPGAYHFYFGDRAGTPGSILTLFPLPDAQRGRIGPGQAAALAVAAAPGTLAELARRLAAAGVGATRGERFGEPVLALADPDGLPVEIIESVAMPAGGLHSATLWLADPEPTARLLTEAFGYAEAGHEATPGGERLRLAAPGAGPARLIDLLRRDGAPAGRPGAGTVHHIAFRAADEAMQADLAERARSLGRQVTGLRDRTYFRSVYFREPGGVLFEIATDGPGFAVDEPAHALGRALQLPPQFAPLRGRITAALPPVRLPA